MPLYVEGTLITTVMSEEALVYHEEYVFTYGSEGREASDVGKVTWFVRY